MDTMIFVYVTVPDEGVGIALSQGLVKEKLAACVNIHGPQRSLYWWEGQVHNEVEYTLFIKTTSARYDAVRDYVKHHHPYKVAPVLEIPVARTNPDFLAWLNEAVQ